MKNINDLIYTQELKKLFTSFYKNNLVCLQAKNGLNGSHLGKMIIDLDESKKGISHTLIRSYLINVRKNNHIIVDNSYTLKQTLLQNKYDEIFSKSSQYLRDELLTVDQLINQSNDVNGAQLVLVEDGSIIFLKNQNTIEELRKNQKRVALIGKVINIEGDDILNELQYQNKIILKDLIPYKQVILNKVLLLFSGLLATSIFTDIYSKELKMNLLNPLIKNQNELQYVFDNSIDIKK